MITIFHVFFLFALIVGMIEGASFGWHRYGIIGVIPGAALGMLSGGIIGYIPGYFVLLITFLRFKFMPTVELRKRLHEGDSIPNFILVELSRRGEDIYVELPVVQKLLISSEMDDRTTGWAALTSAYPELRQKMPGYHPTDSTDVCRKNCELFEELVLRS